MLQSGVGFQPAVSEKQVNPIVKTGKMPAPLYKIQSGAGFQPAVTEKQVNQLSVAGKMPAPLRRPAIDIPLATGYQSGIAFLRNSPCRRL
jgi:hypothetical protein